jgi:hypothetical protein
MALEAAFFEDGEDLLFEIDGTVLGGGDIHAEGSGDGGKGECVFH